jgi:hypothetical protein
MTTIAYHHESRQISCDSRQCSGERIVDDDCIKYHETDDGIWFVCGVVVDEYSFISEFEDRKKTPGSFEANAFFVEKISGDVYYRGYNPDDETFWQQITTHNRAIGSGLYYAEAAMTCGKDAYGAIDVASKHDVYTGGKIRVYDIESGKFIDVCSSGEEHY